MHRVFVGIVCVGVGLAGASLGSPAGGAATSAKCPSPPVTMRLEAGGSAPVGGASFSVSDGVARRVAILPKAKADFTDTKARARLEDQAAKTSLALYTVYLADFEIPRTELKGFSFGDIKPTGTGTIATLSIVPPTRKGFVAGAVVTSGTVGYDTTTSLAPIGLTVRSDRNASAALPYTTVLGQVKIIELTAKRLCLDIDVEVRNGTQLVTAARGIVAVPVMRAANSFYFT